MIDMELTKLITTFLKYLEDKECSHYTVTQYRTILVDLQRFLEEDILNGRAYLEHIELDHLQMYMSERKKRGNCAKTRSMVLQVMRTFWNYLYKRRYICNNLPQQLDDIKVEKRERVYLTQKEFHCLLDVIENETIRAVAYTLGYTGLRISELKALSVKDVDFENEEIKVLCGKGKKGRTVPLHPVLKPVLQKYFNEIRNQDSRHFFATKRSGTITQQYVNNSLIKAANKAGIEKHVTAHILRHSFASGLVSENCNITVIQKLLGHADLKTTSIYLHVNRKEMENAVKMLK